MFLEIEIFLQNWEWAVVVALKINFKVALKTLDN